MILASFHVNLFLNLVLSANPVLRDQFFDKLPGGLTTFTIYKWLVVAIISLYIIPISIYALFYCKCSFLIDVIFGTVSFLFYTLTYMNLLNTFALCRIDDISWGTKGLDAGDSKNSGLKDTWRIMKTMYVAKFLFWNIIFSAAMLIVSSPFTTTGFNSNDDEEAYNEIVVDSYVRKFFMVFVLMAIIGITLFIKIFLGAIYSIAYRCCVSTRDQRHMKT